MFFFLAKGKKKRMALSNNEIINITTSYMLDFDLEEKHSNNIKKILKNHGNKPFYIYRYILFVKNFLLLSKAGMYTIEVASWIEHIFLDKLQKSCYMQLKKRRTVKEPLLSEHVDEIYLAINVFL